MLLPFGMLDFMVIIVEYSIIKSANNQFLGLVISCPEIIKRFSYSTQLSMKFILLINVKMPTIVGILTFISMINITSE